MTAPPVYRELEDEIEQTRRDKEASIEAQEFEKAAGLRDKERRLTNKKRELEDQWQSGEGGERPEIGEDEIADIVSMWTGIPVFKLTEAESKKLMRMEDELHKRVIGQQTVDRGRLQGDPPLACGPQGPQAPDRLVHLPRPLRRREDRAGAHARRVPVRRRGRDGADRHVRVHGEALRVAARRFAARLHRLRRGRPADRGRAAQALLRAAARRDREGAPGRVQHPAPDPGGRPADRRAGSHRRLPQRDRDHDLEHRGRRHRAQHAARLLGLRRDRDDLRRHEEPDHGRAEEGLPARVPEPPRRGDRLPQAHEGRDQGDRRAADAPPARVDGRARAPDRAVRGDQGLPGRKGLGPGDGRPAAAPRDPALHRGPARRRGPEDADDGRIDRARRARRRGTPEGSRRWRRRAAQDHHPRPGREAARGAARGRRWIRRGRRAGGDAGHSGDAGEQPEPPTES